MVRAYVITSRSPNLAQAHLDALNYLREGGDSITCNCGYAKGYSVLEVIDVVKSVSGVDFPCGYRTAARRPLGHRGR